MFPNVYGFRWEVGYIIFLAIFFAVVTVIAVNVVRAFLKARNDKKAGHIDHIRWHTEFEDLPALARTCRHVFTGDFKERYCVRGFDCGTCEVHNALIQRAVANEPSEAAAVKVAGIPIEPDALYHRGHTVVRPQPDGAVRIEMDEFAQRLIGSGLKTVLPFRGTELKDNGVLAELKGESVSMRLLSPVSGKILKREWDGEKWAVIVEPAKKEKVFAHLLRGREAVAWLTRELERLEIVTGNRALGATLADGGELVGDPLANEPPAVREHVLAEILLEP